MIPASTVIHAEPPHPCVGCRTRRKRDASPLAPARMTPTVHRFCLLHVTPFARCGLYEKPPAGKPSHLSSLMTR
jgi:hypothetical protein